MSASVPLPISLLNVSFVKLSVIAVPEHKPPANPAELVPQNEINVRINDAEPLRFVAEMSTKLNLEMDPKSPYAIDVTCLAVLVSDGSLPAEDTHRAVMITAHSVLYGAIREAVAWITSRHVFGPLTLGLSMLQTEPPAAPAGAAAP